MAYDSQSVDILDFSFSIDDAYYSGLSDIQIEFIESGNLSPIQMMHFDLERGIIVWIEFNENIQRDNHTILSDFLTCYPRYYILLRPILDHDPKYASMGSLQFHRNGEDVEYKIILRSGSIYEKDKELFGILPANYVLEFIQLVEPLGAFTTNNGDNPVNY